jgi:predicted transcriptional regulator YdeE
MNPEIVKIAAFDVVGLSTHRDYSKAPSEGALWDAFVKRLDVFRSYGEDDVFCGVNVVVSEEATRNDIFNYLAGIRMATPAAPLPLDASTITIPELLCAQFSFPFEDMEEEIRRASKEWLPEFGYERDDSAPIYDFLMFPAATTRESLVTYAIPVRPR